MQFTNKIGCMRAPLILTRMHNRSHIQRKALYKKNAVILFAEYAHRKKKLLEDQAEEKRRNEQVSVDYSRDFRSKLFLLSI